MLKTVKRTAAAVFCGILTASALPVVSVSAMVEPEKEYMTSLYEDYDPVGDDVLCINATEPADVRIVQHSPERENLVLFDCKVTPVYATTHVFPLEPGDYTIYISMSNIAGGATKSTYTQDFTIANADYSVAPDQFGYTYYDIVLATEAIADNAEASSSRQIQTEGHVVSDHYYACDKVTFGRYSLMRGDFDGSKSISALDAQNVLSAYAASLTDSLEPDALTEAQKAACDIDGNGELTAIDAQSILLYYAEEMVSGSALWPDEQADEPVAET